MPIRSQFASMEEFEEALRDWFAGQALAALIMNGSFGNTFAEHFRPYQVREAETECAYDYADAMLAERNK